MALHPDGPQTGAIFDDLGKAGGEEFTHPEEEAIQTESPRRKNPHGRAQWSRTIPYDDLSIGARDPEHIFFTGGEDMKFNTSRRVSRETNKPLPNFPLEFDDSDEATKNTITRFLLKNPNTRMIVHIPPQGDSFLEITDYEHQVKIPLLKINDALRKGMGNLDINDRELMRREITTPGNENQKKEIIKRLKCLTIDGSHFQTNAFSILDERGKPQNEQKSNRQEKNQAYNLISNLAEIHDNNFRVAMDHWLKAWTKTDGAIDIVKVLCNDRDLLEAVLIWNRKTGPVVVPAAVFADALGMEKVRDDHGITELQVGNQNLNAQTTPEDATKFFKSLTIDGVQRRDIGNVTIKQKTVESNNTEPTVHKNRTVGTFKQKAIA